MHPVADKITMTSFEGTVDLLGKGREVAFITEDGDGPAQTLLVLKGLTMAEAWEALSRLHGPVAVAGAQADPKPKKEAPKSEPKKEPEQLDLPKTEAKKEAAKPEPKKSSPPPPPPPPEPEEADIDVDDLADDPKADDWGGLDVEFLSKQDKLRPVIEHLRDRGHNTVEKVVAISRTLKATVPALQAVEAKGGFDARMERNAMVVLAEDGKAS